MSIYLFRIIVASLAVTRCVLQDEHGHTIHDPRALDPREAIIAHAEAAKKNAYYTSVLIDDAVYDQSRVCCCQVTVLCQAYAKTQPKPIYHKEEGDGGWHRYRALRFNVSV